MNSDWSDQLVEEACNALRTRREELKLTRYKLAKDSGMSWQTIAAYETHKSRPTLECLIKVSAAMGLKGSQLLRRAEVTLEKRLKGP